MGFTRTKTRNTILLAGILGLCTLPVSWVQAQEQDPSFQYGGPCSQLTRLTYLEMSALVHPAHSEQFVRLCSPESVYTCADYSQLVDTFGSLEENGNLGCRFIPGIP
jgi:hypothetical protein